jgi:hypothetical protein
VALATVLCVWNGANTLHAQAAPPLSLDLTIGRGSSSGGTYRNRGGLFGDALVGYRLGDRTSGGWIAGASIAAQGSGGGTDICILLPSGGCVPDFPSFYSVGGLLGWATGTGRGTTMRLLAGPAYLWASEGDGAGIQGRLDVSTASAWHLALVAAARGMLLPNFDGSTLSLWSFGVGISVQ